MDSQGACPVNLADILETPGLCQQVYDKLDHSARLALRQSCRSIRQQVEQCVGTLAFLMSEHRTPEQMHASMGQLATSRLSPKKMRVVCIDIGHIGHSDHGLAQYFARPDYRHVWSKVKVLSLETWCYEQLLQVLAPSMPHLQELTCDWLLSGRKDPPPGSQWPALFKHLPHLHTLTLPSYPSDFHLKPILTALQGVPSLRSLTVASESYPLLAQLTQLQVLTLVKPIRHQHILDVLLERGLLPDASSPGVLSALTGLISLEMWDDDGDVKEPSQAWQAQLATALAAMHQLRRLVLPQVWQGPVAQALSQMQQLTELDTYDTRKSPGAGLVLPGVQILRVRKVDLSFLDSLVAPQLQVLQGGVGATSDGQPHLCTMVLHIKGLHPPVQQAAALERCMQGVMRHCNHLELCFPKHHSAASTPSDESPRRRAAVLTTGFQILSRCWRPDPNLVDGSSPLNPLRLAGGSNARVASVSGGWGLTLSEADVTSSVAAALPPGLTYLNLRSCRLDTGGLLPLGQLRGLRELVVDVDYLKSAQPIIELLSSSAQGCFLRIELWADVPQGHTLKAKLSAMVQQRVVDEAARAQATLKAERGSKAVPQLEVMLRDYIEEYIRPFCTFTLH